MFINGKSLLKAKPIADMFKEKIRFQGTSYGLGEAGYDIRIKQKIEFTLDSDSYPMVIVTEPNGDSTTYYGRFCLACSMESFHMPHDLVGTVKDKSTWARQGLSVFNTVIEPGWNGILTLELVHHANDCLTIEAGSGIAQVLFGAISDNASYGNGKYQNATGTEEAKS